VLPRGHALDDTDAIQLAQLSAEKIILHSRQGAPELFDAIIAMCRRAKILAEHRGYPVPLATCPDDGRSGRRYRACACVCSASSLERLSFRTLRDKRCQVDVVLAWRQGDPDAIREGFLSLLRKSRPNLERAMQESIGAGPMV